MSLDKQIKEAQKQYAMLMSKIRKIEERISVLVGKMVKK